MRLGKIVTETVVDPKQRIQKSNRIAESSLGSSKSMGSANFNAIDETDLSKLFQLVDDEFFQGAVAEALIEQQSPVAFRLSRRMTSSGGITTTRIPVTGKGPKQFEIAISSTLLFESFGDGKPISVTGVACENRFQALQKIMEHEMIHLIEMLLWHGSSCAAKRFQTIAKRFFGHHQSTHQLLTPADRARRTCNISPGDWVSFRFERKLRFGYVNRITRRATVLVPSENGIRYTDGKCYEKFYVPISQLSRRT